MFSWLVSVNKFFSIKVCCDGVFCADFGVFYIIYLIYIFIDFQVCFLGSLMKLLCVCACARVQACVCRHTCSF